VSLSELTALARRHALAVALVLLLAAGTAYSFKHTAPLYQESATLVLTAPQPQPYTQFGSSLVTTGEIAADWVMGVAGQRQVAQAGGGDSYAVALVNFSNQEYPYYVVPYLTVSASGASPAAAHQAFLAVTGTFDRYLAARQQAERTAPRDLIGTRLVGDTGPVLQQGSRIRSFAGLGVLTIVAAFLVARFLDRHPLRPRLALAGSQWRSTHHPA
jgi:hypothetical protein